MEDGDLAAQEEFPDGIQNKLIGLREDYVLAADVVCGTIEELDADLLALLAEYENWAPELAEDQ